MSFETALSCATPSVVLDVWQSAVRSAVVTFVEDPTMNTLIWDRRISAYWSFLQHPVFSLLIDPMFSEITDVITASNGERRAQMYPALVVIIVLAVITICFATFNLLRIDAHMRTVLRFLQHCPPDVILKSHRIMAVINGDLSSGRRTDAKKAAEFFSTVIEQIPDAILFCTPATYTITSSNAACERIFGARFLQAQIQDFLGQGFKGQTAALYDPLSEKRGKTVELVFSKSDVEEVNLEAFSIEMEKAIAFVFRDVTQTIRYNTLIAAERTKSDQMLQSILPPSLVPRVQAGEKNISLAVTSATICFIDIVSFTPWCGASQADTVMLTLNNMFKRFDHNCSNYSMMTRIKCIGDCYMAAGGLFADVNQPTQHAKQVISFGLDCLKSIAELNAELGESLQIRVGVNTGGPIVAGVIGGIGSGKPTFEIIGPAINMAQQMEHHGIPGNVHISRSVYELIYGGEFKVAERGSIEIKNANVVTYLVSGRNT
jgi:class 3 adenylate cyclase/PAS domain-containing protein